MADMTKGKHANIELITGDPKKAINKLADGFTISAISDDNVIEAIEKDNIIGIQWHPEKINDKIQQGIIKLFDDLLEEKR